MASEMDLFNRWKQTQDKKDFQSLYNHMREDIKRASQKAAMGSNIPESAHRIWAAQNFYNALNTYKPNMGASLKTHVFGAVQNKAHRLNYQYQNVGSMPEDRVMQVQNYKNSLSRLRDNLNRDPSAQELADDMGVGVRDVTRMSKEIKKDLALVDELASKATYESDVNDAIVDLTYYDLNPVQQTIFEHAYGLHGKPKLRTRNNRLDYMRLSRATNLSQSKLRQEVKKIEKQIKKNIER